MAKIEHGEGRLLSIDTTKKILRFQEIRTVFYSGQPPAKEWEIPYALDWKDPQFFDLVGKRIDYILSDNVVVGLRTS